MKITRFAPSPTGYLHIGGVRTALYNWLIAKKTNGKFLLRIEDTDRERSKDIFSKDILDSLAWLNIDFNESIVYQSKRTDIYKDAISTLLSSGKAYYCDMTQDELNELRKKQMEQGLKPKYDCRNREKNLTYKKGCVVRYKFPQDGETEFNDNLKGKVVFPNNEIDDFIIQRADGTPTYNLVVIVDDVEMGVNSIVRGDDHLSNTPKQIQLLKDFNYNLPEYTHVPLILGKDGKRLSKRHGALSAMEYRKNGILPTALLNYLVRLGWASGNKEKFEISELIDLFDLKGLNKSAAIFDEDKLLNINKYFIQNIDIEELVNEFNYHNEKNKGSDLNTKVIECQRMRHKNIKDLVNDSLFVYEDISINNNDLEMISKLNYKKYYLVLKEVLLSVSAWEKDLINEEIKEFLNNNNMKMADIGPSLRLILTGTRKSPDITSILYMLGKDRVIDRLDNALSLIT